MYTALIGLLVAIGIGLLLLGQRKHRIGLMGLGVGVIVLTLLFFLFLGFWGEALWFEALGYGQRFWTVVLTRVVLALAGAGLAVGLVHLLIWSIDKDRQLLRIGARVVAAYVGARWGYANWDTVLLYLRRVETTVEDPILARPVGFYLFVLPFYDAVYTFAILVALVALGTWGVGMFVRINEHGVRVREAGILDASRERRFGSLYWSVAFLVVVLAWGMYLNRFHLLYSTLGIVNGPGWTDVHVRLPAYMVLSVLMLIVAVFLVVPVLRGFAERLAGRFDLGMGAARLAPIVVGGAVLIVGGVVLLAVLPGLTQWLYVQPNEITVERPYIRHNIEFTRRGFHLHDIEEHYFDVSDEFTRQMVEDQPGTFDNIRLWDWRALEEVYEQFQEIRLYYEFHDVDIDRYTINDTYRQVMVAARELNLDNLAPQSQTFVNRRFKYTHGYGITLTAVNEFTPEGLPDLLVKDIPPRTDVPGLEVSRPEIYYGELTDTHVIVNSSEPEFNYPEGEENVYAHYEGTGGVLLHNRWRRFLFGWKFDGTRLFLSGYPTEETRIQFHRRIQDRVRQLAPFLQFDDDPYIVLVEGKLYWILDAYTTSSDYPYSEPFYAGLATRHERQPRIFGDRRRLRGINYIRNSVKTVIDAYNGSVDFYVFEPDDPLIRTWREVFPGLFKDRSEMPQALEAHIRYPVDMLLTQGLIYAKYHMTDPVVFYNQEDLWIRATETYYGTVQPVDPYYIMWEPPDIDDLQFILMMPFTPKNRQVLIGWIAGMCDPGHYGTMLAYKFPKEIRVLGTQQMETKIDQDAWLARQLALWDQRGSRVIRGNVLVIPLKETLFYVEPIYLQAEAAAYPELRMVAVMHGDRLRYAPTFDEALEALLDEPEERPTLPIAPDATVEQWVARANQAFEDYLAALGEKRFSRAAEELETLQDALERLLEIAPTAPADINDEQSDDLF